ncbi:hypothetical protein R1sor_000152 [Riccia sorocarpa]|uniref:Core-binding (CB) domain-containing protein n=1 Tax=Riccia sorocarpa TaxID=122646 RepID=A0ABD3GVG6_9MARC
MAFTAAKCISLAVVSPGGNNVLTGKIKSAGSGSHQWQHSWKEVGSDQTQSIQGTVHCAVSLTVPRAKDLLAEAEERWQRAVDGPLEGVPFTYKEFADALTKYVSTLKSVTWSASSTQRYKLHMDFHLKIIGIPTTCAQKKDYMHELLDGIFRKNV